MNDEPVKAAELVRKTHGGLSRYRTIPDTLTELSGTLEDVQTIENDDAWIVVRPVDGLNKGDFATATIRRPTAKIDKPARRHRRKRTHHAHRDGQHEQGRHRAAANEQSPDDQRHKSRRQPTVDPTLENYQNGIDTPMHPQEARGHSTRPMTGTSKR